MSTCPAVFGESSRFTLKQRTSPVNHACWINTEVTSPVNHACLIIRGLLKEQSHEIVRLPNRTICEKSCGCKTSPQFYLRFVGVVFAYLHSRIGSY